MRKSHLGLRLRELLIRITIAKGEGKLANSESYNIAVVKSVVSFNKNREFQIIIVEELKWYKHERIFESV